MKSIIFIVVWLWNLYNQILINRGILFILYVLKAIIDGLIHKCLANFLVYPFHHQAGRHTSPSEPCPETSCPPILLFTRFFKTKTTFPPKGAILYFMLWKEKNKQTTLVRLSSSLGIGWRERLRAWESWQCVLAGERTQRKGDFHLSVGQGRARVGQENICWKSEEFSRRRKKMGLKGIIFPSLNSSNPYFSPMYLLLHTICGCGWFLYIVSSKSYDTSLEGKTMYYTYLLFVTEIHFELYYLAKGSCFGEQGESWTIDEKGIKFISFLCN